ncbi:MAG: MMPL family transporter [Planctomycetota bacterium]
MCRHPRSVLVVAGALAVASLVLAVARLEFRPDRNDLIADTLAFNQRFEAWLEAFPEMTDFLVVVDPLGDRAAGEAFVNTLATELEALPTVGSVAWGAPRDAFNPKTARLLPIDEYERVLGITAAARSVGAVPELDRDGWAYLESPNGELLLVRVQPTLDNGSLNGPKRALADIRACIDRTLVEHPMVRAGLTGIDAIEADETDAAINDSTFASLVALILIAGVLVTALGGWRVPVVAAAALLIGVAWSFGYLALAIGHLQILSVVFVVILLGLGIDFAIHLASALERTPVGTSAERAWRYAFARTGPGVLTGAITTAAAFAITGFTDFRGVAEMGHIAAAGIMLCLVAMYTVFPAMLVLSAPARADWIERPATVFEITGLGVLARRPGRTLAVTGVIVGVAAVIATQIRFSTDLMALQSDEAPSIEWQQRLSDRGGRSIWYGVSIAESRAELEERIAAFRALETVSSVGGAAILVPEDDAAKRSLAEHQRPAGLQPRETLADLFDPAPLEPSDFPEAIIDPFVSDDGRYAIEVYPRLPIGVTSPLDPAFLPVFMEETTAIDSELTGVITQVAYSGELIRSSFARAGVLALAVVFLVVLVSFRLLRPALLSLVPVLGGFALTFAMLVLTGRVLDLASVVVLPLLFGIGVDVGVHAVHRYRQSPRTHPLGLAFGTGKAVVLTSLTTASGFAAMMLASHRGIAGLGFTLAAGILLTLAVCVTALPAAFALLPAPRGRGAKQPENR